LLRQTFQERTSFFSQHWPANQANLRAVVLAMSSNAVTTIKEQYDGVVARLEAMATDVELLETRPDDGIFLDDMLLRLKLWAADVQYDQGSLAWAEKMTHISVPLRERVQDLDHQCGLFEAASKRKGAEEKVKPGNTAQHITLSGHQVATS